MADYIPTLRQWVNARIVVLANSGLYDFQGVTELYSTPPVNWAEPWWNDCLAMIRGGKVPSRRWLAALTDEARAEVAAITT